jgi:hypothetical protein
MDVNKMLDKQVRRLEWARSDAQPFGGRMGQVGLLGRAQWPRICRNDHDKRLWMCGCAHACVGRVLAVYSVYSTVSTSGWGRRGPQCTRRQHRAEQKAIAGRDQWPIPRKCSTTWNVKVFACANPFPPSSAQRVHTVSAGRQRAALEKLAATLERWGRIRHDSTLVKPVCDKNLFVCRRAGLH